MGFFGRFNDSKYRLIGEYLASYAFSMCTHDQIDALQSDCQFSDSEKNRFKFDFFIANLVVATHTVNFVFLQDQDKAKKIIDPMFSMIDSYLKKIVPGNIRIGDFITNDDEWRFLRDNHQVSNPDMITNCDTLFDLIGEYRMQRYLEALIEGFKRFLDKQDIAGLGPMSLLVRLFVQNFPSSKKDHLIVTLCVFLVIPFRSMMEYCQNNV